MMHSPPSKTPLFLSLVRIGVILEPQYIFTPIEIACLSRAKKSFLILEDDALSTFKNSPFSVARKHWGDFRTPV